MLEYQLIMCRSKRVLLNHTGSDGRLTVVSLLRFLQECAWYHAEALGFGLERLAMDGLVWVLREQALHVTRFPAMGEEITIRTWPSRAERILCHRDFLVLDNTGAEVARATSAWFGLDLSSRRPHKAEFFFRPGWEAFPPAAFEAPLPELLKPQSPELTEIRTVRRSDLDALGHVNNLRYVEWILDQCPPLMPDSSHSATLQIRYVRELMLGESVQVVSARVADGDMGIQVLRVEGGQEACLARISYTSPPLAPATGG